MVVETLSAYLDEFHPCFVVLREDDLDLSALIANAFRDRVTVLRSDTSHLGMGASLAEGVRQILRGHELSALFVALADMPCVAHETLATLHRTMQQNPQCLLRPTFDGRPGHPVGFSQDYFPEMMQLVGDAGARNLLKRNAHNLTLLPVTDPGVCLDFDLQKGHTL